MNTSWGDDDKKDEDEEDEVPQLFQIMVPPTELKDVEIMWTIALESKVEKVYSQAIIFLVSCYTEVEESLSE